MHHSGIDTDRAAGAIDVSIVMPCLNEIQSLPHCIANAKQALAMIASGEIIDSKTIMLLQAAALRRASAP